MCNGGLKQPQMGQNEYHCTPLYLYIYTINWFEMEVQFEVDWNMNI